MRHRFRCFHWWVLTVNNPLLMYPYMNVWITKVRSLESNKMLSCLLCYFVVYGLWRCVVLMCYVKQFLTYMFTQTYVWWFCQLSGLERYSYVYHKLGRCLNMLCACEDFRTWYSWWTLIYDLWYKNMRSQYPEVYVFIK